MSSSRLAHLLFFAVGLLATSAPSPALAQTFTGSLTSGVGSFWYRPNASCVQEPSSRLYQRINVFANQAGTYTFTATRTSGTGIVIDAFRSFPVSNCTTQRYSHGTEGSSSSSVTVTVSDTNYPIVLVVSSSSALTTGGYTVTVSGPAPVSGDCLGTGSLSSSTRMAPIGGGSYSTTYTPPSGVSCSGFAILNRPAWVTGMPTSGGGTTSVPYTVSANPGGPRTAYINIGQATLTVAQAGTCNFTLNPTSTTVSGAGGVVNVSVSVNSGCPFTATTASPWITIADPSGTGPRTLAFTVAQNTGAARVGSIDVEGATLTVSQNAACTYAVGSTELDVASTAGTQMVSVTTQVGCPITGASDVGWITPLASGAGSGTTSFAVAANPSGARSGNVTLGAASVRVNQASGCVVSLPVASTSISAAGASTSFLVTTGAGCAYSVESNVDWLSATPGAGHVDFTALPSASAERVGTITVMSTSTASSAAYVVTQSSGCVPSLGTPGEARDAAAGTGSFAVPIDAGCGFTATSEDDWIHTVEQANSGVTFAVEANSGLERVGTIDVTASGGTVSYAITQAMGCAVTVSDESIVLDPEGAVAYVDVTTGPGCSFEVSVPSDASWLEIYEEGSSLHITADPNLEAARSATLTVRSVEGGGDVVVSVAQASAVAPPVIDGQPKSRRAYVGETFALIVVAAAEPIDALAYQWRKDGVPIGYATHSNALWLSQVDVEDAGDYDVVVSTVSGSVTSEIATVEIVVPRPGGCAVTPGAGQDAVAGVMGLVLLLLVSRRRRWPG